MDISKIDVNFSKVEGTLNGKDVYSVTDEKFDLYGVSYNEKENCFERIPNDIAFETSYGVGVLNRAPAGARLRFSTNSKTFTIYCKYNALTKFRHMPLSGVAGFSLICNIGDKPKHLYTFIPTFEDEKFFIDTINIFAQTRHSKIKKNVMQDYTLYFPLYNQDITEIYIAFDKGSKVGKGKEYKKIKPILYYGSSITQGGCASRPDNSYQSIIEKQNNIDYINLGYSGSCRAEEPIVNYISTIDSSVFVLDYDHNTPSVEHLEKTHFNVYEKYRKNHNDTPIIMISAVDYDCGHKEKTKRRNVVKQSYLKAVSLGDKNVYYIDGRKLIPKNLYDSAFVEGIHPNDIGFLNMAKTINKVLKKLL